MSEISKYIRGEKMGREVGRIQLFVICVLAVSSMFFSSCAEVGSESTEREKEQSIVKEDDGADHSVQGDGRTETDHSGQDDDRTDDNEQNGDGTERGGQDDGREEHSGQEDSADAQEDYKEMKLTAVSLQPVTEGNAYESVLYLSGLKIRLPKGWESYAVQDTEGINRYVLADRHTECATEDEEIKAHKDGYEHEIMITCYSIENMPENPVELAGGIREEFDVPELWSEGVVEDVKELDGVCWMRGEDREDEEYEYEYFIFVKNKEAQWEMFHITESIISGYENDLENFYGYLDSGKIRSVNSGSIVNKDAGEGQCYYYRLKVGEEDFIMSAMEKVGDKLRVTNYKWGEYKEPISQREFEEMIYPSYVGIKDMDGDGDEDFVYRKYELKSYREDGNYEGCLWEEEELNFVYVSSEEMLKKSVLIREKQKEAQEIQQACKERAEELILAGLIEYLSSNLLGTREEIRDMMLPMVSDRELSMEEVKILAAENKSIWKEMQEIAAFGDASGIWLLADADNDGTEDVMLCQFLGGSGGEVNYILFRGIGDGTYEKSDVQTRMKEEFAFIAYEGKNYLARTTYHFGKKIYDGIELDCYENGEFQGSVWVRIAPGEGDEARNLSTSYIKEEKYRALEQNLHDFSYTYESYMESPKGTAEEVLEDKSLRYDRISDFNNDGVKEYYHTDIWLTTNYYTADCMEFYTKEDQEEADDLLSEVIYEQEEGTPMYLWVDATEFGNVTYVLFEKGLYDFSICGYLVTSRNVEKLIQTDCIREKQVVTEWQ